MRRIIRHAVAGVAVSALGVGAAVAGLTGASSATEQPAANGAVRAPVGGASDARANRTADQRATRGDARPELTVAAEVAAREAAQAAAAKAAHARRVAGLEQQRKAVVAERNKLKKERAAKKAAQERRIKKLGYEPGTTDPKEIARQLLKNKFAYDSGEFDCFDDIIMRESMWDIDATNPSSGAYGIPQALPGSKMGTVGDDWRTNPATQIIWAVGYMEDRYGSPCGAWGFKSANGWY